MLKARIVVHEDTDIAAEIERLDQRARRSGMDPVSRQAMINSLEAVLGAIKQDASETAAHGISIGVTKHITSPAFDIAVVLESSGHAPRKGTFFTKFFRR